MHDLPDNPKLCLPLFIYGTGSYSDEQETLTFKAICRGYRAIDTGPTPAYNEELTAEGIRKALLLRPGLVEPQVFVQTKISPADRYQDSIPFEVSDTPFQQVVKSFEQSQRRFSKSGCTIRALLLHAPFPTLQSTMQYWKAMETLVDTYDNLSYLGICNATLGTLRYVHSRARIKPVIVQNSFRAASSFDRDVIEFCRANGLVYQAYGVLTSNLDLLSSKFIGWFAETRCISEAEALFVLIAAFGRGTIHILHASHDEGHMAADLRCQGILCEVEQTILEGFEELLAEVLASSQKADSWSY